MREGRLTKLINKRKELAYTQEDMAALLGVSLDAYRNYEQGRRKIKIDLLKKIAEIFKCTIDELI